MTEEEELLGIMREAWGVGGNAVERTSSGSTRKGEEEAGSWCACRPKRLDYWCSYAL